MIVPLGLEKVRAKRTYSETSGGPAVNTVDIKLSKTDPRKEHASSLHKKLPS